MIKFRLQQGLKNIRQELNNEYQGHGWDGSLDILLIIFL